MAAPRPEDFAAYTVAGWAGARNDASSGKPSKLTAAQTAAHGRVRFTQEVRFSQKPDHIIAESHDGQVAKTTSRPGKAGLPRQFGKEALHSHAIDTGPSSQNDYSSAEDEAKIDAETQKLLEASRFARATSPARSKRSRRSSFDGASVSSAPAVIPASWHPWQSRASGSQVSTDPFQAAHHTYGSVPRSSASPGSAGRGTAASSDGGSAFSPAAAHSASLTHSVSHGRKRVHSDISAALQPVGDVLGSSVHASTGGGSRPVTPSSGADNGPGSAAWSARFGRSASEARSVGLRGSSAVGAGRLRMHGSDDVQEAGGGSGRYRMPSFHYDADEDDERAPHSSSDDDDASDGKSLYPLFDRFSYGAMSRAHSPSARSVGLVPPVSLSRLPSYGSSHSMLGGQAPVGSAPPMAGSWMGGGVLQASDSDAGERVVHGQPEGAPGGGTTRGAQAQAKGRQRGMLGSPQSEGLEHAGRQTGDEDSSDADGDGWTSGRSSRADSLVPTAHAPLGAGTGGGTERPKPLESLASVASVALSGGLSDREDEDELETRQPRAAGRTARKSATARPLVVELGPPAGKKAARSKATSKSKTGTTVTQTKANLASEVTSNPSAVLGRGSDTGTSICAGVVTPVTTTAQATSSTASVAVDAGTLHADQAADTLHRRHTLLQSLLRQVSLDPVLFVLRLHVAYVRLGAPGAAAVHAVVAASQANQAPSDAYPAATSLAMQLSPGALPLSVPLFIRLVRLFGIGQAGGMGDALAQRYPDILKAAQDMPALAIPPPLPSVVAQTASGGTANGSQPVSHQ